MICVTLFSIVSADAPGRRVREFLDEVLDGADVFFQKKLANRMQAFIRKAGATIFVSHSLEQIRQVCNEVLVLHKGKIHFMGEVEQGWQEYLKLQGS